MVRVVHPIWVDVGNRIGRPALANSTARSASDVCGSADFLRLKADADAREVIQFGLQLGRHRAKRRQHALEVRAPAVRSPAFVFRTDQPAERSGDVPMEKSDSRSFAAP